MFKLLFEARLWRGIVRYIAELLLDRRGDVHGLLAAAVVRSGFGKGEAVRGGVSERDSGVCRLLDADELGRLSFLRAEVRRPLWSEAAVSVELDAETGGRELSSVLIDHEVFVGARIDVHGLVAGQEDVFLVEFGVSAG